MTRTPWAVAAGMSTLSTPNPSPPNDPELRRCLEQFSRDLRLGPDNETIVVLFDMKIL
jgi:hypothetical protein